MSESDAIQPIFTRTAKIDSGMDAAIDMYYFPASAPCRSVLMLARALGLVLNLKMVNIMAGEQMQPDYLKMNPMHSVPTMDDNGFILWESRAIMQYLVDQYAKDDSMSPKDAKSRALVNQRLYFDSSTLMSRFIAYFFPVMMKGEKPDPEKRAKVEEALQALDVQLENSKWAAADRMTIADFGLIATVSTIEAGQIDIGKYPNVMKWFEQTKKGMADFGYEEINQKGVDMLAMAFKSKLR